MNDTKRCNQCSMDLPLASFGKSNRNACGLRNACKKCRNAYEVSRYGKVTENTRTHDDAVQRFWSRVTKSDGCWEWSAGVGSPGYGEFRYRGKVVTSHRFSWMLEHGAWPDGHLCHHCDNRRCVRPSHMFVGTQADNVRDMDAKGRRSPAKGSAHGHARLTESDVVQIRSLHGRLLQREIADIFGVDDSVVCRVISRVTWKHVP